MSTRRLAGEAAPHRGHARPRENPVESPLPPVVYLTPEPRDRAGRPEPARTPMTVGDYKEHRLADPGDLFEDFPAPRCAEYTITTDDGRTLYA